MNNSVINFDVATRSNVGTSVLKGIRPKYDTEGDRMFIFNDKILRLNLLSNTYTYLSIYQANLPFVSTS